MAVKITRISQTRKGRFALFAGEEFLFSVDDETYVTRRLAEGMVLDEAELDELRQCSETRKAIAKAFEYVSLRDHAAGELYEKLSRKFDAQSCRAAVEKMKALDLLNDYAFALHRAKYLMAQGKSRRAVQQALAQKGIARETAAEVLAEVYAEAQSQGEDPEMQALRSLIEKSYARKLQQGRAEQVMAALYRRGFPAAAVRAAVREYQEQTNQQEDF